MPTTAPTGLLASLLLPLSVVVLIKAPVKCYRFMICSLHLEGKPLINRRHATCCLFDACGDESQARVKWLESGGGLSFADWRAAYPRMVDKARDAATAARTYRDATPVGKLDIANVNAQQALAMMTMAGGEIDRGLAEPVAARAGEARA